MYKKKINIHSKINSSVLILLVFSIMIVLSFPLICVQSVYAESPDDLGKFAENPDFESRLPEYEKLKAQNGDTVGWIYIDGTKVDNVLMQNKEEKDFYIDKDFNKKYYYPGTLYISDISDLTQPTDVVIMYGHNMKDRSMFGSLREFEDPEFLKKYDKIIVDDLEGRKEYEITHVMRIRVNVEGGDDFPYYEYSNFKDEADYNSFIGQCNEHALYDSGKTTEYGDDFVMLTTCEYTYADGTGRLVIMGKTAEPIPATEAAITRTVPEKPEPLIGPMEIAMIMGGVLLAVMIAVLIFALRRKRK